MQLFQMGGEVSQPEARLSREIMKALRQRGAYVWKVHGGPMTTVGLPDIIGVWQGQFIAVESKMPGGALHGKQPYVIGKLLDHGARVVVAHSVSEALYVVAREYTPDRTREALTASARASSERAVRTRSVRGDDHVAELLSGARFID